MANLATLGLQLFLAIAGGSSGIEKSDTVGPMMVADILLVITVITGSVIFIIFSIMASFS